MLRFIFKRKDDSLATMDVRSLAAIETELRAGGRLLGVELMEEKGVTENKPTKRLEDVAQG